LHILNIKFEQILIVSGKIYVTVFYILIDNTEFYRMKRYFLSILFLCIVFITSNLHAQTELDSLEQQLNLNTQKGVDPRLNIPLIEKLYELSSVSMPYLALEYAGQALQVAIDLNDKVLQSYWTINIADIYFEQKIYYLAMESYFKAYTILSESENTPAIGYTLINIGDTYYIQNVDDIALSYYRNADSVFHILKNVEGEAKAKIKIGRVNMRLYQYDIALELFQNSLAVSKSKNNTALTAEIFSYLAEAYKLTEDYELAVAYFDSAITMYKISGDKLNVAKTYFSLADVFTITGDNSQAIASFEKSLHIFVDFKLNSYIATIYNRIGYVYFVKDEWKQAMEYVNKSYQIALEFDLLSEKSEAYLLYSQIYAANNDFNRAYNYHTMFASSRDSVNELKKAERFSELQVSLSTKEKEKELAIAAQELKRRKYVMYGLIGILVLIVVFFAYLNRNSNKIKRANELLHVQNEEINMAKEEIELQKENLEFANIEIIKQKEDIEEKSFKITSSINYASRIQQAMLLRSEFIKSHFSDGFVLFKPKEAVSGDFYWFSEVQISKPPSLFRKEKENVVIKKIVTAVIDCTGHGVPGAFMSMLGDAYLSQLVNLQKITDPAQILSELHKAIRATLQQETSENNDGMDAAICVIDKAERKLEFAGAKNPLIYIQNDKLERVNGDLMSIGGLQKEKERLFSKHTIDISVKTRFYLFSDGFQDQFGGQYGRKYMAKPFRDLLFTNFQKPFSEQKDILLTEFNAWHTNYIQMDDVTVVGIYI